MPRRILFFPPTLCCMRCKFLPLATCGPNVITHIHNNIHILQHTKHTYAGCVLPLKKQTTKAASVATYLFEQETYIRRT